MLTELHIESLGVIDRLDLVLGPGLVALTGETGAGKTMLVEAINLLVGGRAEPTMVRHGTAEARVEGRFVVGGDEVVVARVIPADGRSRAYLNGRLATAANLAELGQRTVDLHGQHAHQSLLSAATQRAALDHFGSVDLAPLAAARARLTEIDAALAALGGDTRTRAREVDLLRFQVGELDQAGLDDPDEDQTLERREDVLADAAAHLESAERALAALGADDDPVRSALAALGHRQLFADAVQRLREVAALVDDIAADVRSTADSIVEDPQQLDEVRARRQLLRDLRRKYGDTLTDVIEYREEARGRLAELEGYEQRIAELEEHRRGAERAERKAAHRVAEQRRAAAEPLGAAITTHLRTLAMPHADLAVVVNGDDPADDVAFLLAANPGSPPLPLSRVASGGELARTMLALRLVLTEAPETLVFDEVDAGIGGSAAVAVGAALAELGHRHQVLVVTHLPQVAAQATVQIAVSKTVRGTSTTATAQRVAGEDRIDEVARMLSGELAGAAARAHAAQLLGERG